MLMNNGANASLVSGVGGTALHGAAQGGHVAVAKLLVKAGADLEVAMPGGGSTPLHLASQTGYLEVMGVLIEAGANPNSRAACGLTPLHKAAFNGHVDAIKLLLRAKANQLLIFLSPSGDAYVPLDMAAERRHSEVVAELLRQLGVKGCGGLSDGVHALEVAAQMEHVEIMGMLTSAGVVDTGLALHSAAAAGCESSAKFLLQQQEWTANGQGAGYLEGPHPTGETPLMISIWVCCPCSPRIARLLVDAGADTTTGVKLQNAKGVM